MATPIPSTRETETHRLLVALAAETSPQTRTALTTEIVRMNLGVCDALAARYVSRGIERDDLVQVARLALLWAIDRFRIDADRPFLAFAVPTITGELKRYFRDRSWLVRPPRSVQERRAQLTDARGWLEQQLGRTPLLEELAAATDISVNDVVECLAACSNSRPQSIDATLGLTAGLSWADTIGADDVDIESLPERITIHHALDGLTVAERQLIDLRFVDGASQAEIGHLLGVSQMQVSRQLGTVLARLRQGMGGAQGDGA